MMSLSQRVLLGGIGFVAFLMVMGAVWTRVSVMGAPRLSGERTTLTPALADFSGIEASDAWDATVTRGNAWRVELEVPVELADRVEARVDGGRLVLGLDDGPGVRGSGDRRRMRATITLPRLDEVSLSGASEVEFSGFDGEQLRVALSGASELDGAASRYDQLALTASGASDADLEDITVVAAEVSVSGASSVSLRMGGGRLTGNVSGASSLDYSGMVSEETVSSSGASHVDYDD